MEVLLKPFMDRCVTTAKNVYTDPEMDGAILVFAECTDPANNILWCIYNGSPREKEIGIASASISMRSRHAINYAFMTLAWISEQDVVSPSESEDRKEILLVSVMDRKNNIMTSKLDVIRDEKGDLIRFSEDIGEISKEGGPILDRLNPDRMVSRGPEMDAVARVAAEVYLAEFIVHGEPLDVTKDKAVTNKSHTMH